MYSVKNSAMLAGQHPNLMTSNTSYNLNPYHVLQIDETASYEEVRERFLMLSKTFHPDKQPKPNYDIAK